MALDTVLEQPWELAPPVGGRAPVIVVGVDGSPTSWDAFAWAAREAGRTGGRLVAVHVTSAADPAAAFGFSLDYAGVEQARQAIDRDLRDDAARRAARFGVPVSFLSGNGDTSLALAEVAASLDAALLVVGRSTKMLHRLVGSVSRRLARCAEAQSVVVVP